MLARRLFLLPWLCLIPSTSHAGALHDASKQGDVPAIAAALDAGATIDEPDAFATPLYYAVSRQHLDAVRLLIERGADVRAGSKLGDPPLMAAAARKNRDLIALLLRHGAHPDGTGGKETALHVVVKHGCLGCVAAIVEAGANVNARTTDATERTPIHIAKYHDHSEIAEYLMEHGVVLPKPAPIANQLAAADVEKGKMVFGRNCDGCHTYEQGKANKAGPNLWGVVGRDKASVAPEADHSRVLLGWEGVWTYEDLNTFLYDPILTTPGMFMEVPGIRDESDRVNLIAYLRTLSTEPIPLP